MRELRQTSLEAYENIKASLGSRQLEVLNAISRLKACTNTMVSDYLQIPINCVTGRTRELYLKALICEDYIGICPITNKRAIFWKVAK